MLWAMVWTILWTMLLKALCSGIGIEDPGRIEIVRTLDRERDAIDDRERDSNASKPAAQKRPETSDGAMAIAKHVPIFMVWRSQKPQGVEVSASSTPNTVALVSR